MSGRDCSYVTGYVDPNFPNPNGESDACIIIYGYTPVLALCILALILFFIALIAHTYLLVCYRTWYFSTIVVGIVFEIVGYIARTLSSQKSPYSVPFFVIQYFFIVTAPVFFSAAIYTIITVMINRIGRSYSPLPPKTILWFFITCDIIATIVQITGAALVGSAYSNRRDPTTPNNILLAGLAFQVFAFFIFIVLLLVFLWRICKVIDKKTKTFAVATVLATVMVYLRTCFRLAETAEGLLENLSSHEVFFGCLEFAPIVVAVYVFIVWHPGRCLGVVRKGQAAETG